MKFLEKRKSVLDIFSNTLTDFSQTKSDAVSIEARSFELLEKDYKSYLHDELGEMFLLDLIEQMCSESLSPNHYLHWLIIKHKLSINRKYLVEDSQFKSEANEAKVKLATETFEFLKVLTRDSDADSPDFEDAINCLNI